MTKILISACLIGQKVRYDGKDCLQQHQRLQEWFNSGKVVSICPEMAGGLSAPRSPAEIQSGKTAEEVLLNQGKILTIDGQDISAEFLSGANKALALAQKHHIHAAILKARSPSCGSSQVYDGTHSHNLVNGKGVTAALLSQHGVKIFDETQIDEALDYVTRGQTHDY